MRRSLRSALVMLEIITFLAVLVSFFLVFSVFSREVSARYFRKLGSELTAAVTVAERAVSDYSDSFRAFAESPGSHPRVLADFADLYHVDNDLRVVDIQKRRPGSALFIGLDLSRGKLGDFLAGLPTGKYRSSAVLRAPEDERPSIYIAVGEVSGILVGRVILDTLLTDIERLSSYSGSLIGIADTEGFILLGSSPKLPSPLPSGSTRSARLGDETYHYLVKESPVLGARIAVFEPASVLTDILVPMSGAFLVIFVIFSLLLAVKTIYTERRILKPIRLFSTSLASWSISPGKEAEPRPAKGIREYMEIEALYAAFNAKAEEIRRVNEGLEAAVAARTEELRDTNTKLASSNKVLTETVTELERTRDLLILSEKSAFIGRMAAGIAHDLNTPLAAIKSSAETIHASLSMMIPDALRSLRSLSDEETSLLGFLIGEAEAAMETGSRNAGPKARAARRRILETLESFAPDSANRGFLELLADDLADMGLQGLEPSLARSLIETARADLVLHIAATLSAVKRSALIVNEVSDRASQIVLSLKAWTYGEDEKPGLVDISAELQGIISLYGRRFGEVMVLETALAERCTTLGSAGRLNRVWVNIIDNALEAMGEKGRFRISTRRLEEDEAGFVEIAFSDTGPGIPVEYQDRIFDYAFTTKPRGKGSGLGLDICKRIVELHGGKIYFETNEAGTTFFVRLKAAD